MARNTRTYLPGNEGSEGPPKEPDESAANVVQMPSPSMRLMPKRLRKEAFGRRLWSLMMAKEWTQSDLARFSDIQRASISSYINGQSFPDPKNLQKLARALGMAPEKLLPNAVEMSAKASENPPFQITATRDPKIVWLDVHQLTTSRKARDVSAILDSDDDAPDGN